MKLQVIAAAVTAGLMSLSIMAEETASIAAIPSGPPEKAKLSYAVGMRIGLALQHVNTNVDTEIATHAIQEVLEGKTTALRESELAPLFNRVRTGEMDEQEKAKFSYAQGMRLALLFKRTGADMDPKVVEQAMQDVFQGKPKMTDAEMAPIFMQEQNYETAKTTSQNKTAGQVFLAENAKKPGIQILPDGLQYQIIDAGRGPSATTNDFIFVKYRGTFINGRAFDHHDRFFTRITGGVQAWQDVLPKMKVGAKWRVFAKPELAFGAEGEPFHGVGPDATVVYDLELLSIAPPGTSYQVSSGLGKGLDVGASPENSN